MNTKTVRENFPYLRFEWSLTRHNSYGKELLLQFNEHIFTLWLTKLNQ